MRRNLILSLFILIAYACFATPLAPPPDTATSRYASVLGVWRANVGSLPMMTLTVEEYDGKLTGAVLFYLIRREPGVPQTSSAGVPEPLIDPAFDGKTLTFKVSHRHAHPGTQNDPPATFRFDLSGDGKIRFPGPDGQQVEMVRETPN
jgi:hypothetical protein